MQSSISEFSPAAFNAEHDAVPVYAMKVREFASGMAEIVVRLTNPFSELRRIRDLGVRAKPMIKTQEEKEAAKEENLRRAERRARQQVSFKIRSIGADHLLTLTYRENMSDSERLKRDFTKFIRLVRVKFPDWQYVAVKEYQLKNFDTTGRHALHMHVACVGKQDIKFLRRCWYEALGGSASDSGEQTLGAVNVQYRAKRSTGRYGDERQTPIYGAQELANYLTKYISKTFEHDRELGERRYTASHRIEPPKTHSQYFGQFSAVDGSDMFPAMCTIATQLAYTMGLRDVGIFSIGQDIVIVRGSK